MKNVAKKFFYYFIIILVVLGVNSCGQTGQLYLKNYAKNINNLGFLINFN